MTRFLKMALVGAVVLTSEAALFPLGAMAQTTNAEIIVYGDDPCPRSTDDDIVVCSRRPETERYRLAPAMRPGDTRQVRQSWAERSEPLKNVGATGIGNCSPVGPGGHTGCLVQEINRAFKQNDEAADEATPPE